MKTNKKPSKRLGLNKIKINKYDDLKDADSTPGVAEKNIENPRPTTDVPAYCKVEHI